MTHDFSSHKASDKSQGTIAAEVAIEVAPSQSFTAFDEWMDGQLEKLVAQWIHTAAPNANRLRVTHVGGKLQSRSF